MPTVVLPGPVPVLPTTQRWPLHDTQASRLLEHRGLARAAPHALMAQAGLAVARLALAVAPHAQRIWVACGPGNNGGDGLVAARWLHRQGRQVQVSLLADPARLPADAAQALAELHAAGVATVAATTAPVDADLAIDALLGLGAQRAPEGALAEAIGALNALNHGPAPVLAVDLPSGLHADTGRLLGEHAVRARHTLALLSLKPGLFTAQGRDHAGRVWLDMLGQPLHAEPPSAWLHHPGADAWPPRAHHQHKGSFGDVVVLGGAPGMAGAAVLAARAALTAGGGRVLLALQDEALAHALDNPRPELMPRRVAEVLSPTVLGAATVVCGCGGGTEVRDLLPAVLEHARRLVLDADAVNALAFAPALRAALCTRSLAGRATVMTPHPLEAARLLGSSTAAVQANRLGAAQALAQDVGCTVLLKGTGTVLAAPGELPRLNPTGNARLGTAGSGDVLAGWLGGQWSTRPDAPPLEVAADAAWLHGHAAEAGDMRLPLRAADLVQAMAAALPRP